MHLLMSACVHAKLFSDKVLSRNNVIGVIANNTLHSHKNKLNSCFHTSTLSTFANPNRENNYSCGSPYEKIRIKCMAIVIASIPVSQVIITHCVFN